MTLGDWVMAAVLFSGVIALLVLQAGAMVDTYNAENVTSEEFSNKFDKFTDNTNLAGQMWNQTSGEGGLSTIGTFEILLKATMGVISLVLTSVTLAGTQMFGFTEYFGIPSEVGFLFFTLLLTLLTIAIIFRVLSGINRSEI